MRNKMKNALERYAIQEGDQRLLDEIARYLKAIGRRDCGRADALAFAVQETARSIGVIKDRAVPSRRRCEMCRRFYDVRDDDLYCLCTVCEQRFLHAVHACASHTSGPPGHVGRGEAG